MLNHLSTFFRFVFLLAGFMLTGLLLVSCGDDDNEGQPQVDPLVGLYQLTKATAVNSATSSEFDVTISEGDDILKEMSDAMLASAGCQAPDTAYIDVLENGLYQLACKNTSSSIVGGSWEVAPGRTRLNLTINKNTEAGNPISVYAAMTDLEDDGTKVSGKIEDLELPLIYFDPIVNDAFANISVDVELEFTRIER